MPVFLARFAIRAWRMGASPSAHRLTPSCPVSGALTAILMTVCYLVLWFRNYNMRFKRTKTPLPCVSAFTPTLYHLTMQNAGTACFCENQAYMRCSSVPAMLIPGRLFLFPEDACPCSAPSPGARRCPASPFFRSYFRNKQSFLPAFRHENRLASIIWAVFQGQILHFSRFQLFAKLMFCEHLPVFA